MSCPLRSPIVLRLDLHIPNLKNDRIIVQAGLRRTSVPNSEYRKWYKYARTSIHTQIEALYHQQGFSYAEDPLLASAYLYTRYHMWKDGAIDVDGCELSIRDLLRDCRVIEDDEYRILSGSGQSAKLDKQHPGVEIFLFHGNSALNIIPKIEELLNLST